jgi:hypothetical protein
MVNVSTMLMIVRRGATERFRILQALCAGGPIEILWDRRVADRRQAGDATSVERRQRDRRESSVEEEAGMVSGERRGTERRQRPQVRREERRCRQRRGRPPLSWTALDFILVKRPGQLGPRP